LAEDTRLEGGLAHLAGTGLVDQKRPQFLPYSIKPDGHKGFQQLIVEFITPVK